MNEPTSNLEAALDQIEDRWDARRTERTLGGLHHKQRRSRQLRALVLATTLCALAAAAVFVGSSRFARHAQTPVPVASTENPSLRMQLADGSQVLPEDQQTRVVQGESTPQRTSLELVTGKARFDVVHREERVFRVVCGEVTVEVLGTSFELERDVQRTHVAVLRGRVLVSWNGGQAELSAGEAGWFPRAPEEATATLEPPQPSEKHATRKAGSPPSSPTWREPAEQGDFEHAYELLARMPQPVGDNVEELLLAADTARLSGHPAAALPFLRRVIAAHSQDSRAPLAAFTLGGVLMQQLGQPREAEAAYARARELSLNSSLAEDALARQVEAAHRGGDSARARTLATEYLSRYPAGRRVHAVQRFGGLVP